LHGLSFSHPYDEPGGLFTSIISSSWISPTRFGETVIWDQNRLRRYPAGEKERIRTRHRQHFVQAGFDADKICADDNREVGRYTIWAWRQLEKTMDRPNRSTHSTNGHDPESAPEPDVLVDHLPAVGPSNGSRHQVLPVFDYQPVTATVANPDGPGTVEVTSQVTTMGNHDLRQCDSCALAVVCPLFSSGSSCRYEIPVQIRNRDQLMGILHSLLEMQGQRVAFGFFAEQLQGGYPDANLSAELDRFMSMTAKVKEIQDNRDFLKVTVEGRTQAGVLSRLFGEQRAQNLKQVDADKAENAVRRAMDS